VVIGVVVALVMGKKNTGTAPDTSKDVSLPLLVDNSMPKIRSRQPLKPLPSQQNSGQTTRDSLQNANSRDGDANNSSNNESVVMPLPGGPGGGPGGGTNMMRGVALRIPRKVR